MIAAWTSFLARVRWRTSAARRAIRRRSAPICSPGTHTPLDHARREQARERGGVEAVGLDARVSDRAHLGRVGDHDARDVRLEDAGDLHRPAGRLEHHFVVAAEALGEQLELVGLGLDPPRGANRAALCDRDLAEIAMYIQRDCAHACSLRL